MYIHGKGGDVVDVQLRLFNSQVERAARDKGMRLQDPFHLLRGGPQSQPTCYKCKVFLPQVRLSEEMRKGIPTKMVMDQAKLEVLELFSGLDLLVHDLLTRVQSKPESGLLFEVVITTEHFEEVMSSRSGA